MDAVEKKSRLDSFAPLVAFVIIFGGLEAIVRAFGIPRWVLPAPSSIVSSLVANFVPLLLPHFIVTIEEVGVGFLVGVPLGIALAAVLSQFKIIDRALSPYVILLVTTPLITLVPLFMLWLGFGIHVRMLVVIIQTFPIVMMNSVTGFNNVEELKTELMESLGASRLQTFWKVIFPSALPQVFTGIRLGGVFATIAAISTEFAGGKNGLGNRIVYFSSFIQTELAFACIVVVALIGIGLFSAVLAAERKVIRWRA